MKSKCASTRSARAFFGPMLFLLLGLSVTANAVASALQDVSYSKLGGDKLRVALKLSGPAPNAGSFTTDNPARIAIDLPNTTLALPKKYIDINAGPARNLRAVEAQGRTRVVLAMTHLVPYTLESSGDYVYLTLGTAAEVKPAATRTTSGSAPVGKKEISAIDFRRGAQGQGRVIVTLDPSTVVDMAQSGNKIIVNFLGAQMPKNLERRLNVLDFATPVKTIDTYSTSNGVRMVIDATEPYEHLAYQTENVYTIEVKPVTKETEPQAGRKGAYKGEKLSLNFQNIEVRAVLQLIADFTGLNVVASDTVQGTITLRLKNVPWDQALDIILKAKGLGMRQNGNVILIAPNEELAAREKQELEAKKQMTELAPLRTEYFQINYAKATDIAALLKGKTKGASILSERGSSSVDERTNTLMVTETADKLDEVSALIQKLDIPVRQVLIESRIVIANDDFSRSLGVKTGVTAVRDTNGGPVGPNSNGIAAISGSAVGTDTMTSSAVNNLSTTGTITPISLPTLDNRLNVNLPVGASPGRIAMAILGADYLVDLELNALQQEGKGEVVSSPRVITANQKEAVIKQGVEIPYLSASASGATSVAFKDAVLSLSVTPQITPDDRVIMDLKVNKDSKGEVVAGVPSINTRSVQTQVLVANGDTVVLGGIYEQERINNVTKVPFLGDIPILGALFRNTTRTNNKAELLIFVTPKILKEGLRPDIQ